MRRLCIPQRTTFGPRPRPTWDRLVGIQNPDGQTKRLECRYLVIIMYASLSKWDARLLPRAAETDLYG